MTFCNLNYSGYGDITPKKNNGKVFLVFYGGFGIPLMVWLLAFFAQIQTICAQKLAAKLKCTDSKRKIRLSEEGLVVILSLLPILPIAAMGVCLIWFRTGWSKIDCFYYWFCTVTTIGFGDLTIPNHKAGFIFPWILAKLANLAVVAGAVNSFVFWLQKKKLPKLGRSKKKMRIDDINSVKVTEFDGIQ